MDGSSFSAAGERESIGDRAGQLLSPTRATERWMRTLQEEEADLQEYGSLAEVRREIGRVIEDMSNRHRLHTALDYRPPNKFEELSAGDVFH